jgi:hypothetical protein
MNKLKATLLCFAFAISIAAQADTTPATSPDESQLVEHGHYVNKTGQEIHAPAHSKNGAAPTGATARCSDGTFSFSQHRSGTCSHHGGVSGWLKP